MEGLTSFGTVPNSLQCLQPRSGGKNQACQKSSQRGWPWSRHSHDPKVQMVSKIVIKPALVLEVCHNLSSYRDVLDIFHCPCQGLRPGCRDFFRGLTRIHQSS